MARAVASPRNHCIDGVAKGTSGKLFPALASGTAEVASVLGGTLNGTVYSSNHLRVETRLNFSG
jgi:hypothetical protein